MKEIKLFQFLKRKLTYRYINTNHIIKLFSNQQKTTFIMNFTKIYKRLFKKCATLMTLLLGIWIILFLNGVDSMVQYLTALSVVVGYFAGGFTMVKEIKASLVTSKVHD